jgi:hypothetical protein
VANIQDLEVWTASGLGYYCEIDMKPGAEKARRALQDNTLTISPQTALMSSKAVSSIAFQAFVYKMLIIQKSPIFSTDCGDVAASA